MHPCCSDHAANAPPQPHGVYPLCQQPRLPLPACSQAAQEGLPAHEATPAALDVARCRHAQRVPVRGEQLREHVSAHPPAPPHPLHRHRSQRQDAGSQHQNEDAAAQATPRHPQQVVARDSALEVRHLPRRCLQLQHRTPRLRGHGEGLGHGHI
jgi:hypothetical protein